MARSKYANNAKTTTTGAVTSGATTFSCTSLSAFPTLGGGEYFYATLLDASNIPEVIKVTAVSGNTVTTCVRAQDGTSARAFTSGAYFSHNVTKAILDELAPKTGEGTSGTWGISISGNAATATTATSATTATTATTATSATTATTATTATNANNLVAGGTIDSTATGVTQAADSNNTRVATTAFVIGQLSSSAPADLGNAAAGSSLKGARSDHVHKHPLTLATPQNTTSVASIDFTGIPSGVKRITIAFSGVSTNGTSIPMIQIGDSGGIETSGYTANGLTMDVINTAQTTGFALAGNWASNEFLEGIATLVLLNSATNLWAFSSNCSVAGSFRLGTGSKAISAVLDRIRLTTVGGSDTFDAGSINILYE